MNATKTLLYNLSNQNQLLFKTNKSIVVKWLINFLIKTIK